MRADVLVDTSVWIAFLRRGESEIERAELTRLLEDGRVALVDAVVAELLYGVRGTRERSVVLDLAAALPRAAVSLETWIAAGDLGRGWRARGRTLSLTDCLLAAVCQQEGLALWTLDRDFDPLIAAEEIRRYPTRS